MTLIALVVGAAIGQPGAAGAVPSASAVTAPYTGLTVTQSIPGNTGTLPKTRTVDARTRTVRVTGSRTSTSERWTVSFTPGDGSPAESLELVRRVQPLRVGTTDAWVYLTLGGDRCLAQAQDVSITQLQADPSTGQPSALAVDVDGYCQNVPTAGLYRTVAHLRLGASTSYGGLDLPLTVIDWGRVASGEVSLPVVDTLRYVGSGSATVARVAFRPWYDSTPSDVRLDTDTCTGAVLTDGATCEVAASARRRAAVGLVGVLTFSAADGTTLAESAVRFQDTPVNRPGSLIEQAGRALDTRTGEGGWPPHPVPPHGVVTFSVVSRTTTLADVAGGTSLLDLVAVSPAASGYLSALAPGATTATSSSLNFARGETTANLVAAPVDAAGRVRVLNASDHPVDVLADLEAVLPARETCDPHTVSNCGQWLHPVPLSRILDTRTPAGGARPLSTGTTYLTMRLPTLPYSVTAVLATVTVVSPAASGWVQVGSGLTVASNVNFSKGRTTSNTVLAATAGNETQIPVVVGGGPVHVVVDVSALLDDGTRAEGAALRPLPGGAVRVADSRRGLGLTTLAAGRAGTLTIPAALRGPDTVGVLHNLTAVASRPTWLTAYPTGTPRPLSSVLNVASPGVRAATMLTTLSTAGSLDVYSAGGPTDVLSDVAATVDLWPPTDRLRGFPRLPVDAPALGLATRSR